MNVVDVARSYINKKEKPGNSGFEDPAFETEMINEGWQRGWSWCSLFAKLCFKKAYPERSAEFNKLFTPGAVATFTNFKNSGYEISTTPEAGRLVIWQHYQDGKPSWQGHAGIVSEVVLGGFKSVEGNTSANGSRNGDRVFEHQFRTVTKKPNGLNVLGFVKI